MFASLFLSLSSGVSDFCVFPPRRSCAIESFHLAITLAPEFVRATYYFNLGYAHSEMRSWNEAIEALKKAIQVKPRKHVYHNLIVSRKAHV